MRKEKELALISKSDSDDTIKLSPIEQDKIRITGEIEDIITSMKEIIIKLIDEHKEDNKESKYMKNFQGLFASIELWSNDKKNRDISRVENLLRGTSFQEMKRMEKETSWRGERLIPNSVCTNLTEQLTPLLIKHSNKIKEQARNNATISKAKSEEIKALHKENKEKDIKIAALTEKSKKYATLEKAILIMASSSTGNPLLQKLAANCGLLLEGKPLVQPKIGLTFGLGKKPDAVTEIHKTGDLKEGYSKKLPKCVTEKAYYIIKKLMTMLDDKKTTKPVTEFLHTFIFNLCQKGFIKPQPTCDDVFSNIAKGLDDVAVKGFIGGLLAAEKNDEKIEYLDKGLTEHVNEILHNLFAADKKSREINLLPNIPEAFNHFGKDGATLEATSTTPAMKAT